MCIKFRPWYTTVSGFCSGTWVSRLLGHSDCTAVLMAEESYFRRRVCSHHFSFSQTGGVQSKFDQNEPAVRHLQLERHRSLAQATSIEIGSNYTSSLAASFLSGPFSSERHILVAASFLGASSQRRPQILLLADDLGLRYEYHHKISISSLPTSQYSTPFLEKLSKASSFEIVRVGGEQIRRYAHFSGKVSAAD